MSRYLKLNGGKIVPWPTKKIKPFCMHKNQISGISCSEHGLERISGLDRYKVCCDCGKLLSEYHMEYK